ncbi:PGLS [Mytilus edulis]|uniref:6-phosphogluconolactonase n=1 Tax=Mytilus edulis TaxID=6550 RepID=A0A8S3TD50_MYTED|nr:PGLS [Mytilus edulis]
MAAPIIRVGNTDKEVSKDLCQFVIDKATSSIQERGTFTVGVSGGSLVKYLCNGLPSSKTDWTKWRIFFCDERHVPYDNSECTYTLYKTGLVDKVGMPPENIFPINPDLSVEDAAVDYEKKIRLVFPETDIPRFDLLLLGMGPDGHTCSLFPGHQLLEEKTRIISPIKGKADIVQRVLEGKEEVLLPAARVRPTNGDVIWYLDKGAASKLKNI